jgi:hypothetical protein
MSQNAIIDIAIGLVLMYLVLSLVCTVINEFIATFKDWRSSSLEAGVKKLLDDPAVRNAFYSHGLIQGTAKVSADSNVGAGAGAAPAAAASSDHPSYFSAETFTLALLGTLNTGKTVPGFEDVQNAITNLPPSNVKSALLANLAAADHSLEDFRKKVASWFDDSMDRLGGVYKRKLKTLSLIIGLGVAVLVNADTFEVGKALWSDSALRAQMVQIAADTVKKGLPDKSDGSLTAVAKAFQDADTTLRPLPIGWPVDSWIVKIFGSNVAASTPAAPATSSDRTTAECFLWSIWWLFVKVIGLIVTGLALSLGAPFWFDLLGKFVNVRGAGPKPERADKKA